jgi:hypothetical protein
MGIHAVLVASPRPELRQRLVKTLERAPTPIRAVAVDGLEEGVPDDVDAAVLPLAESDDLALAVRLREARPDLPLFLVTPKGDDRLAEVAGRTQIGTVVRGPELLLTALESRNAARSIGATVEQTHELAGEVRRLARGGGGLSPARSPRCSSRTTPTTRC